MNCLVIHRRSYCSRALLSVWVRGRICGTRCCHLRRQQPAPRRVQTIPTNVERAGKQIALCGLDGVIFVDFSLISENMNKELLPQAKDSRWHAETNEQIAIFHNLLGQYIVGECRSAGTRIKQPERAGRVLGMTPFACTTLIIGGAAFGRPPQPTVVWCKTHIDALQPGGERLNSDFESG